MWGTACPLPSGHTCLEVCHKEETRGAGQAGKQCESSSVSCKCGRGVPWGTLCTLPSGNTRFAAGHDMKVQRVQFTQFGP